MNERLTARLSLDRFLEQRGLSTYRLMKQLEGRVGRGTVYSLASGDVQRVDLGTLAGVLTGLRELTGEHVTPNDLLEVVATSGPDQAAEPNPTVSGRSNPNLAGNLEALLEQAAVTARVTPGDGRRLEPIEPFGSGSHRPTVAEMLAEDRA